VGSPNLLVLTLTVRFRVRLIRHSLFAILGGRAKPGLWTLADSLLISPERAGSDYPRISDAFSANVPVPTTTVWARRLGVINVTSALGNYHSETNCVHETIGKSSSYSKYLPNFLWRYRAP
jgi:hypothetical protein